MPTIKGQVEQAKFLKSGQGAKGPWSMFEVIISGQKFTGFGDYWTKHLMQPVEVEFKEEQRTSAKGTSYLARTLQAPRSTGGMNPQQLQSIEKKLDEVLSILKREESLGHDDLTPGAPEDDGPALEDIPF